jgi:hypothetical protein
VLCAVTKLNSVDVHSLRSCTVCVCTDDNDIRPHTVQEHNERTSMEFNLVTGQSTAHEPPEDGRKYGPQHVGKSFLKCF